MSIYKTRWFERWARKERLGDANLVRAVEEMSKGLIDVDLGGGLVKKRIGRRGYGKRGGYRTLLATNRGDRWVFVYGFPKNERSNIAPAETEALKKLAAQLLSMSVQAISTAVRSGELLEVHGHAQDAISDS